MLNRRLFLVCSGPRSWAAASRRRSPRATLGDRLLVPATRESRSDRGRRSERDPPQYHRQIVEDLTGERPGTVVVDPDARFLYLVMRDGRAALRRRGRPAGLHLERHGHGGPQVGGRAGPAARDGGPRPAGAAVGGGMPGRADNPLGARALYLYQNDRDTLYRIHGTAEVWSIGRAVSSGCVRLLNADVIDLYNRVPVGARVVVPEIPPRHRVGLLRGAG